MKTMDIVRLNDEIAQLKKRIKRNNYKKPCLHLSAWLRIKMLFRKIRGK